MLAVITVSTISAKGWNAGLRIGSGFQAQTAYEFNKGAIEARFGMTWYYGTPIDADFQVLYYRNVLNTHEGIFIDAGAGFALGGRPNMGMYYGVTPSIKFGYKFSGAPVKIGVDWSPVIGGLSDGLGYFTRGLANVGVSCVYCF